MNDFVSLVRKMRQLQRAYFEARRQNLPEASTTLNKCKQVEREVDSFLKDYGKNQTKIEF